MHYKEGLHRLRNFMSYRYGADKRAKGDGRLMRTAPALGSSDSDTSSIDWSTSGSSQPVHLIRQHFCGFKEG